MVQSRFIFLGHDIYFSHYFIIAVQRLSEGDQLTLKAAVKQNVDVLKLRAVSRSASQQLTPMPSPKSSSICSSLPCPSVSLANGIQITIDDSISADEKIYDAVDISISVVTVVDCPVSVSCGVSPSPSCILDTASTFGNPLVIFDATTKSVPLPQLLLTHASPFLSLPSSDLDVRAGRRDSGVVKVSTRSTISPRPNMRNLSITVTAPDTAVIAASEILSSSSINAGVTVDTVSCVTLTSRQRLVLITALLCSGACAAVTVQALRVSGMLSQDLGIVVFINEFPR